MPMRLFSEDLVLRTLNFDERTCANISFAVVFPLLPVIAITGISNFDLCIFAINPKKSRVSPVFINLLLMP